MASITLKNITKEFAKKTIAVDNVSLDIVDEEFLVLVGPSGCGKSTLMRMIAGLETPTMGVIKIAEGVVNHLTPKERDTALVFQSYALYPHKNVYSNLAFPLQVKKIPKAEINEKVLETADIVGIGDLLERKPKELSGGQRQRVALGRAIIREPRVFLMDEPLSNLDAKLRVKMRAELKKLQKTLKITTIYVTHDQVEAMTMGDRIAVMEFGVIQQVGTPEEIFYHPINKFVAGFIGSPPMNFIDVTIVERDGRLFIQVFDTELPVPKRLEQSVKSTGKKQFTMGVRPQKIILDAVDISQEYTLNVNVSVAQPRGTEVDVEIEAGSELFMAVFPTEQSQYFDIGQQIVVGFDPKYIYLFDPDTEETLF